jgi:excisionase family DNA binding protein
MTMTMSDDHLMTAEDVARYLSVPLNTLYRWRAQHDGPRSIRVGKHLRYRRVDVERWLDEKARD